MEVGLDEAMLPEIIQLMHWFVDMRVRHVVPLQQPDIASLLHQLLFSCRPVNVVPVLIVRGVYPLRVKKFSSRKKI